MRKFHLAIAEASHNAVLLHTIRGLFDLLKRNVVTNIGGMYQQRTETRDMLITSTASCTWRLSRGVRRMRAKFPAGTFCMCRRCWKKAQEVQRVARAERRKGM
jgi:GntR family transcriptional repressor for pyruvate dehydrogenase complex